MKEVRYSFGSFLIRVGISVLLISGPFWALWFVYQSFWNARAFDDRYKLVAIVQTGNEKEALKTSYLAEVLGLSSNRPQNLYRIDLSAAERKLLQSPLIATAKVKRVPPGALYIDYKIRKPAAYLSDRLNAALDEEGYVIPFKPFFTPKKIVHFYLGLDPSLELAWNEKLHDQKLELAWSLLNRLKSEEGVSVNTIDLTRSKAESLGERRIVVLLDLLTDEGSRLERCLILNSDDPIEGIERFKQFKDQANAFTNEKHLVLDLRVPELGVIKKRKT